MVPMDYEWVDRYRGIYASLLNGKIFCGLSSNTESIHHTTKMQHGMLVTWIITGNGILETPGKTYKICNNMVLFRHPLLNYVLTLYPGVAHRRCFFCLPKELFSIFLAAYPSIISIPPVFPIDCNEKRLDDFLLMYEKIKEANDKDVFELMPFFQRYILHFLQPFLTNSQLSILENTKHLLETDFKSSLPDVARSLNVSYNTMRKTFSDTYGMSPSQFRLRAKTDNAKQLLAIGYNCSEVADKLEFPDLYSFSHQFKAIVGVSPSQYQKDHIF